VRSVLNFKKQQNPCVKNMIYSHELSNWFEPRLSNLFILRVKFLIIKLFKKMIYLKEKDKGEIVQYLCFLSFFFAGLVGQKKKYVGLMVFLLQFLSFVN
jgi:hypothetical protein